MKGLLLLVIISTLILPLSGCKEEIPTTMSVEQKVMPTPDGSEELVTEKTESVQEHSNDSVTSAAERIGEGDHLYLYISEIEKIEKMLLSLYPDDLSHVVNGTLAFLRKDKYGYNGELSAKFIWDTFAGSLEREIGFDLGMHPHMVAEIEAIVDDLPVFKEPENQNEIDFPHMVVVADIIFTQVNEVEYQESYYDHLFSWAGDLETLMEDMVSYSKKNNVTDRDVLLEYVKTNYLTPGSSTNKTSMMLDDFLADIDGSNIGSMLKDESILLSEALNRYYLQDLWKDRYSLFIKAFGGAEAFEESVGIISLDLPDERHMNFPEYSQFHQEFKVIKGLLVSFGNHYNVEVSTEVREIVIEGFKQVIIEGAKESE